MRFEDKCLDLLKNISKKVDQIDCDAEIENYDKKEMDYQKYVDQLDYQFQEVMEERLLDTILNNYDIQFKDEGMRDYIYKEIGVDRRRNK